MRAFSYFFSEAAESLWRNRRAAILSVATIAAGLFVLGFFLMIDANLERLVGQWSDSAELAVYLRDDVTPEQRTAVNDLLAGGGLASNVRFVSKEEARQEFARSFPDLSQATATLDRNPFPASFEMRLNRRAQDAPDAVTNLVTTLNGVRGVADVRYDRRWLERLGAAVRVIRGVAIAVVLLLAFASALTVGNVVRLTAVARAEEIEIMQLVGAPFAYIRGPFIAEGLLQGGTGALIAVAMLLVVFGIIGIRFGGLAADAVGLTGLVFVPARFLLLLVVGGMALGCLGGFVVARRVR